jgi:hypothetical protein
MASKRELILQAIGAALAGVSGVGGRVYRSRADGIAREQAPCITYDWSNEEQLPQTTVLAERQISVFVSVYVRGDEPDRLADPIIAEVHAALLQDITLGGLSMDIALGTASLEYEGADKTAGKITHEYQVMFRHAYTDMTN